MLGNKLKLVNEGIWDGNATTYRGIKLTQCVGENLLYINLGTYITVLYTFMYAYVNGF